MAPILGSSSASPGLSSKTIIAIVFAAFVPLLLITIFASYCLCCYGRRSCCCGRKKETQPTPSQLEEKASGRTLLRHKRSVGSTGSGGTTSGSSDFSEKRSSSSLSDPPRVPEAARQKEARGFALAVFIVWAQRICRTLQGTLLSLPFEKTKDPQSRDEDIELGTFVNAPEPRLSARDPPPVQAPPSQASQASRDAAVVTVHGPWQDAAQAISVSTYLAKVQDKVFDLESPYLALGRCGTVYMAPAPRHREAEWASSLASCDVLDDREREMYELQELEF
ncbi:hypothetical protein M011DRAFT_490687 [Sporormia fimetaria CBS 119925]|uniref:Uncharacterized protein n=1 Tax=Sporormia fimetaria CBS 119925 TaxID=1340428 RepID=A0A6A6UVY0_9PLEO|nr:hypothetical protein M011DRAFT_490687 [Sporormia fimetaria CBS 119925]